MNKVLIFSLMAFILLSCKDDDKVALAGLKVSPSELSVAEGERVTAIATPVPADAEDVSYTWSSEDPSIATAEGNEATVTVTGVKEGTTNIVVTSGSISTKTPVTVTSNITFSKVPTPPTAPSIDESDYTSYYFDSQSGNDDNAGTSGAAPFKSLSKAEEVAAKDAKTKLLFKSGSTFTGVLRLADLKSFETKPLIVDTYGGTERATIDGVGAIYAVHINGSDVRFRNIRVTNKSGNRGIYVTPSVAGACRNIVISGCLLEEINWAGNDALPDAPATLDVKAICSDERYQYENGGIICDANTSKTVGPSWFENVFITGNELYRVSKTGIWFSTQWGKRPGLAWGYNDYVDDNNGWYPANNIVVQNNLIRYVGGDAAVIIATRNSFLDHNTVYHAFYLGRKDIACAGIWPHSSIDFTMQYNEVAYTHLPSGAGDGMGMDIDIACINTVAQFNYLHHNEGGGMLICNNQTNRVGDHRGTIVRNNVFFDNGLPTKANSLTVSSAVGATAVYNNTIITTSNPVFAISADWANVGNSKDFVFTNNIFAAATPVASGGFNLSYIDPCTFSNNLFWQIGDVSALNDRHYYDYDPQIIIPVTASYDGFDKVSLFVPANPNVFKNGVKIEGMPEKDILGNPIPKGVYYLGAFAGKSL